MIDGLTSLGIALALFVPCLAMTAGALWAASRLAPWFMKERMATPTVRSFFTAVADDMEPARMTVIVLAAAILLAVLTPAIVMLRLGIVG